ncbi:hypothetical protein [Streptomyces sp. JB150]|uniref:hypothetical protein n=1 Tax=Streptomyces sp. JB150 TaxID=2714844 RepID=UPI00140DDD89|nr:hypothetical protein [Streptomyces sp. JB150]QIJ60646.1 hypothetical protein G7Z13_00280 [Streptomyces sp. JB150]
MADAPQQLPDEAAEPLRQLLEEVLDAGPGRQVTENTVGNAKKVKGLLGGTLLPGVM